MKRLCATGLMLTMGWQSIAAAGPLERSVAREATRLAGDGIQPADRSSWQIVRMLQSGTAVVITTSAGSVPGALDFVNADTIAVRTDGTITRASVTEVLTVARSVRRGSAVDSGMGVVGGFFLGTLSAAMLSGTRCENSCGGVGLAAFGLFIGAPIGAGYAAWRASSHMVEEVIYRRPPQVRP